MNFARTALATALAATLALPALAQIYTWTDASGQRQISDRPPEGQVKDLRVQGSRSVPPPATTTGAAGAGKPDEKKPQTINEKALEFNKRQLEREEARAKQEKAEAEAKERAQRCEQAQANVRSLRAGGRASRVDPKTGERVFLEEADIQKEIVEAQRIADSWCKPPAPPSTPGAPAK